MARRQMHRREFLGSAAAVMASGIVGPASAQAANWPDKPVKMVLPYAPGGATDLIGRPWADALSKAFGQQFVVENRGGASGMIGLEAVTKSPADGYTLLMTPNAPLSVLPSMRKTPYDPVKSFAPIARMGDLVTGFVVHPSLGPKTFKELIDYAKKNPGKVVFGSAGLGTSTHLRIEMLKFRTGADILHVPYRGSADALNDLLPGTIHMMTEINVLPHVKSGKLILVNINHSSRHPEFPDVPTLTELGYPDSDVPIWYSLQAPAGTPADIVKKLNEKCVEIAKSADMKAKMAAINVSVPDQTPVQMAEFLVADIKRNDEVIKAANIKLE